jgi:serine/threonine protein kinase
MEQIRNSINLRIVRKIAAGGMGTVWEAVQEGANGFQKRVAVKTLLPQLSRNVKFVDMFIDEAKLVANLVHENIVQIYQLDHSDTGYYIVMELVNGLTLHEFIKTHKTCGIQMPENLAVFIASRVARGLDYAHSRMDGDGTPLNIVHRDVCPNNVMITTEGLPKLTDFGIARAATNVAANSRSLVGKLSYMPPEQANRRVVDHRCDIFSLGAVLFEMLCGSKVRLARSHEELMQFAQAGVVQWQRLEMDRELSPEIRMLLERCFAKDPNDRFGTCGELAHDLEYHIYKDGYGPTIRTLEEYMMRLFPQLYTTIRTRQTTTSADEPEDKSAPLGTIYIAPAEFKSSASDGDSPTVKT